MSIQDNPLVLIYLHTYRTPPNELEAKLPKHTQLSSAMDKSKTSTTFNHMMRGLAPAVSTVYLANGLFIIAPSVNLTLVANIIFFFFFFVCVFNIGPNKLVLSMLSYH